MPVQPTGEGQGSLREALQFGYKVSLDGSCAEDSVLS